MGTQASTNIADYIKENPTEYSANGAEIIRDTATHEGPYMKFQVLQDAIIDTIVFVDQDNIVGTLNSALINAPVEMKIPVQSIKLVSGIILASFA